MPQLDRETAKSMRTLFKDEIYDLREKFIAEGEAKHGDSLKFWLAFESVEEVVAEFARFLLGRAK